MIFGTTTRENLNARKFLKDDFWLAEHQQNGTIGLGQEVISKTNLDRIVINREGGADAKLDSKDNGWYVPYHTPSIPEHSQLWKYLFSGKPIELRVYERSVLSEM